VVPKGQEPLADRNREALRELLNVSALDWKPGAAAEVIVAKADGEKCERCWHWETDVGQDAAHPTICARCVRAVRENKKG
jgi:isoleucyl-tRNA synthetase